MASVGGGTAAADWDRQLDGMLEDLEASADGGVGGVQSPSQRQIQSSSRSEKRHVASSSSQQQSHSYSASSSSAHQRSQSASSGQRQGIGSGGGNFPNGYGLAKSQSTSSLKENADTMLKDLEGSLKASSNYIESHRTVQGPTSTQEYHEYRSYSNGGGPASIRAGGGPASIRAGGDDFNLERQVQHMMPPGSLLDRNGHGGPQFSSSPGSGLQSANMVSSVQQNKQTYTTYKVQTNQYGQEMSSSSTKQQQLQQQQPDDDGERPGSRLKQNIDELDTLLYDLNNARKISDAGADYTASSITPGNVSSDDYSEGPVKKTTKTSYEYNYQSGGEYSSKKPPSPSPRRRAPGPQPSGLSSPASVRRASPGPSSSRQPPYGRDVGTSSYSYSYSSSSKDQQQQQQQQHMQPMQQQPPIQHTTMTTTNYQPYQQDPPHHPSLVPPSTDGTPTGVSYYTKYHSTHSHQSQQQPPPGPVAFPTPSTPRLGTGPKTQTPPKRVDELMTELSEFDSTIQTTGFVEPSDRPMQRGPRDASPEAQRPMGSYRRDRSPSPARPAKQPSTPGPAVYYPPGEEFTSTQSKVETQAQAPTPVTSTLETGRGGKGRGEYGYKAKSMDKGRHVEKDGKQGAVVVPLCLPVCCPAPCVIM